MNIPIKSFIIKPKSPYNIRSHFENYKYKDPHPCQYEEGIWWRALKVKDKVIPVEVILNEDVDKPKLKVNFFTDTSKEEEDEIINQIKCIFNTDYDLKSLYKFMDKDPILRKIKDNHYGLIPASFPSVYEAVISIIIQQQISLRIAQHITSLLIKKFSDYVKIGNKEFWAFPTPSKLSNANISELKMCKLSERKAHYIKDFSNAVVSGKFDPESLRKCSHQEIINELTKFKGIGRWTAEMVIVTSISIDNMNPAGDLGARKAISHFYNNDKLMSEEEARVLTDKWGKYKGIITYYLIADALH